MKLPPPAYLMPFSLAYFPTIAHPSSLLQIFNSFLEQIVRPNMSVSRHNLGLVRLVSNVTTFSGSKDFFIGMHNGQERKIYQVEVGSVLGLVVSANRSWNGLVEIT